MAPSRRILMGMIGRPHGVRGHVHVTSYTAEPATLASYSPLADASGRQFVLRWRGEGVAEVSELRHGTAVPIIDRTGAEKLCNTRLYVDRSRLPPAEPEEFYLADLDGLQAVDPGGAELGRVEAVHDYGAGASLEIVREGAAPLLVPFTRASVPEIDLDAGRLTAVVPEAVEGADPAKPGKVAAE